MSAEPVNVVAGSMVVGIFAGVLLTTVVWLCFGTLDSQWQSQAVAHGAAEWVVGQKTGKTAFKWKNPK